MTFTEYVRQARVTDNPRGEFIDDTRRLIKIGRFPDPATQNELVGVMHRQGACPEAIAAGKQAWRSYQAALRRRGA